MTRELEERRGFALVAILVAAAVLCISRIANAEGPKRVAVYFEGKGASRERASIVSALPESLEVSDATETEAAIRKAGLHGKVAAIVAKEDKRKHAAKTLDKVAKALGVDAVIVGNVGKQKGDRDVPVLVVHRGGDEDFDTVSFLSKDSDKARADKWGSFLAVAFPPPKPDEESVASADEEQAKADEAVVMPSPPRESPEHDTTTHEKPSKPGHSRLPRALAVIGVAYDAGFRSFSYKDPVTENLRPYHVGGAPGIQVSTEIYPFARSKMAVLPHLGLTGRFANTFAFDSTTNDGKSAKTTWQEVELGLRYRILAGATDSAPLVGIGVGYASSSFAFDGSGPSADQLPGTRYDMIRAGLDGRVPLGPVAVFARASYLQVLGVSPMNGRFPHESVHGVGGGLGVAVPALPWLEARLEAGYDRLFYSFHPEPGETFVAGGALEQQFSVTAGAFVIF